MRIGGYVVRGLAKKKKQKKDARRCEFTFLPPHSAIFGGAGLEGLSRLVKRSARDLPPIAPLALVSWGPKRSKVAVIFKL